MESDVKTIQFDVPRFPSYNLDFIQLYDDGRLLNWATPIKSVTTASMPKYETYFYKLDQGGWIKGDFLNKQYLSNGTHTLEIKAVDNYTGIESTVKKVFFNKK